MGNESYYPVSGNPKTNLGDEAGAGSQMPPSPDGNNVIPNNAGSAGRIGLPGVSDLLTLSWNMYAERAKSIVILVLAIGLYNTAVELINKRIMAGLSPSASVISLSLGIFIIEWIPMIVGYFAIINIVKDKNLGLAEAAKKSTDRVIPYLKIVFITVPIFLIVFLSIMIVMVLASAVIMGGISLVFGSFSALVSIVNWLVGFVLIILVLSAVLLVEVWFFMSLFAVVLEKIPASQAISFGYELLKGRARPILWRIFIIFLVVVLLAVLILVVPVMLFAGPFAPAWLTEGTSPVEVLFSLASSFVAYLLMILFLIYNYNIYENLKLIKAKEIPEDHYARNKNIIWGLFALGVLVLAGLLVFSVNVFRSIENMNILKNSAPLDGGLNNGGFDRSGKNVYPDVNRGDQFQDSAAKDVKKTQTPVDPLIRSNDLQRKSDLELIDLLLWSYKVKNGSYPVSPVTVKLNEDNDVTAKIKSANTANIPVDPKEGYYYGYSSQDGTTFELTARLENADSPDCNPDLKDICLYRCAGDGCKLK